MKLYYDFHIHTALSPCSDNDMTPNNIVSMALIKKLDVIAITDHNSIANCKAVMDVAEKTNLIVIPGMEIQTSEDIHLLCLFDSLEKANELHEIVTEKMMKIELRKEIFGEQLILDSDDAVVGEQNNLLLVSSNISLDDAIDMVDKLGGYAIPAHVNRRHNSILASLSFVPMNKKINTLEVYTRKDMEMLFEKDHELKFFDYIFNSDAHNLGVISERQNYIITEERTRTSVLEALKTGKGIV